MQQYINRFTVEEVSTDEEKKAHGHHHHEGHSHDHGDDGKPERS